MTSAPVKQRSGALFCLLCILWGSNWIAAKTGVERVPAILFTALRSILAGLAVALYTGIAPILVFVRTTGWARVLGLALLINTLTYAGLFWATGQVASGVVAVINGALTPSALFAFGLLTRAERFSWTRTVGVAVGVIGLLVLTSASGQTSGHNALAGILAVAGGTLSYCLGTVLSRRCTDADTSPLVLSGTYMLGGGIALAVLSPLVERWSVADLARLGTPAVLAALGYLSIVTGAIGFAVYLRLVRDLGPSKAGMYAFVSPVIALILGWLFFDESLSAGKLAGAAIMIASSITVMTQRSTVR